MIDEMKYNPNDSNIGDLNQDKPGPRDVRSVVKNININNIRTPETQGVFKSLNKKDPNSAAVYKALENAVEIDPKIQDVGSLIEGLPEGEISLKTLEILLKSIDDIDFDEI